MNIIMFAQFKKMYCTSTALRAQRAARYCTQCAICQRMQMPSLHEYIVKCIGPVLVWPPHNYSISSLLFNSRKPSSLSSSALGSHEGMTGWRFAVTRNHGIQVNSALAWWLYHGNDLRHIGMLGMIVNDIPETFFLFFFLESPQIFLRQLYMLVPRSFRVAMTKL